MSIVVDTHEVVIYHDPEARYELVRRSVYGHKGGCAFCGMYRAQVSLKHGLSLFEYGTRQDDNLSGRIAWDKKYYCSRVCRRDDQGS